MGNPLSRFFNFIFHPSSSRTTGLLVLLVIALSIPLTVFVAQKQQEIRQQAAEQTCSYKSVPRCLYPTDNMPSNCTPTQDFTCPANPETDFAQPALQSYLCAEEVCTITPVRPTIQDTCTSNGGTCASGADACDKRGMVPANGTCTNGQICCKRTDTGGQTSGGFSNESACKSAGGTLCTSSNICSGNDGSSLGSCSTGGVCCKFPSSTTSDTCTSSGGTCFFTSLRSCDGAEGVCSIIPGQTCSNENPCLKVGAGTGGACVPTHAVSCNPACGTPQTCGKTSTCVDNCGNTYTGQCDACTSVPGSTTASPSPSTGGLPTGIAISCTGVDPVCSSGHVAVKLVSGNWVCSNTSTGNPVTSPAPTCPSTAVSGATKLTFTIGLDGIGSTGDVKNPNPEPTSSASRGSNKNPNRPTRTFFYQVFDSAGTTVKEEGQGLITFESTSGKFKATADLKNALADGTYLLKVRAQGYLAKIIRNVTVANKSANVPTANLVTGDTDGNNNLSILDYNTVMGCLFKPAAGNCQTADLDDNGTVDQFDYNLFVREFSAVQQGE